MERLTALCEVQYRELIIETDTSLCRRRWVVIVNLFPRLLTFARVVGYFTYHF